MRRGIYLFLAFLFLCGVGLTAYAPDRISMVFIGIMVIIILLGMLFGILPVLHFGRGIQTALENIDQAVEGQSGAAWNKLDKMDRFFDQRVLDSLFREYREKVRSQHEVGEVLSDIEDYINTETLALHSYQSLITQIPGTLTGLGILGTFIGLLVGIRGIEFSTVNTALVSVQSVLAGIQIAFYTSIAGVILSLMFNMFYRMAWNSTSRQLGLFTNEFHRNVIPPVDEQARYRERRELKQIISLLERMPKSGGFSAAAGGSITASSGVNDGNEQILMPQILAGIREGEFTFHLQPRFDLNTKKAVGAEALVRWQHGKLGIVSPAVFVPVLESNGYITKLDYYIWEQVCMTIRRWLDEGKRPLPISVNVTKTDVLATDVVATFEELIAKYNLSPRNLAIEIAENAYLQSPNVVLEIEKKLRQKGFKVIVDGFNGNYIALSALEGLAADELKLDLRRFDAAQSQSAINALFDQANKLQLVISVEGIESMEQLAILRKCGCSEGQGFYLSKPVAIDQFEEIMNGDQEG